MAYLVKADSEAFARSEFSGLGHIPGIWSKNWEPETEAMDYLIAKGTGAWVPNQLLSEYAARKPLSFSSMLAVGNDLTNFYDWCEQRKVAWQRLSYRQLVENYQADMTSGRSARRTRGKPLSPSTVNRRILSVTDFLTFAAYNGHRSPFEVNYSAGRSATQSERRGRGEYRGPQREGKVREHPMRLRLPTIPELRVWLSELLKKHGRTPYLMARTAIEVGLRPEEVILVRLDQLPSVPENVAKTVGMEICFGTKGGRDPQDPDKRGKSRIVRVPTDLLKDLHGYVSGNRKLCLARFKKIYPDAPVPKELFLSKYTGKPLGYERYYDLWKSPGSLPYKEFSPHIARHVWACYTLVERIREEVKLTVGSDGPLAGIAANLHHNLIETFISTQLGHVDPRTSNAYLLWVVEQLDFESHRESWWDFLNE